MRPSALKTVLASLLPTACSFRATTRMVRLPNCLLSAVRSRRRFAAPAPHSSFTTSRFSSPACES